MDFEPSVTPTRTLNLQSNQLNKSAERLPLKPILKYNIHIMFQNKGREQEEIETYLPWRHIVICDHIGVDVRLIKRVVRIGTKPGTL